MSSEAKIIIHQLEQDTGRHRLLIIKAGIPTHSGWCKAHEFGQFGGYFFQNGIVESLPEVFRATAEACEVLR